MFLNIKLRLFDIFIPGCLHAEKSNENRRSVNQAIQLQMPCHFLMSMEMPYFPFYILEIVFHFLFFFFHE